MPTLEWIGKNKVINHHQDVPFRVLDKKYSFNADGQTDTDKNSKNMIIRGDNLEALKALLPQYEGKVKCIYIDPHYNTGNENWVYNDKVNDPKIKKWLGEVVGKEGEDLSRHDIIAMTENGNILIIEPKGDHLENTESRQKLALSRTWQNKAGAKYRYYMVFKNKDLKLEGAYLLKEFLEIVKGL